MWKNAVMAKFEVLSWQWLKGLKETTYNLSYGSQSVGQDLNAEQSKY
jgi:hypothetical protein